MNRIYDFANSVKEKRKKNGVRHRRAVGKPVPRQRPCARSCKSGSPAPDPFVIRRAQTTDGKTDIVTMELAVACPPRYGKKSRPGGLSYRGH